MESQQESQVPAVSELPKVQQDLKSQLEHFNPQCLNSIDTLEKHVLPTAEGNKSNRVGLYESITESL